MANKLSNHEYTFPYVGSNRYITLSTAGKYCTNNLTIYSTNEVLMSGTEQDRTLILSYPNMSTYSKLPSWLSDELKVTAIVFYTTTTSYDTTHSGSTSFTVNFQGDQPTTVEYTDLGSYGDVERVEMDNPYFDCRKTGFTFKTYVYIPGGEGEVGIDNEATTTIDCINFKIILPNT